MIAVPFTREAPEIRDDSGAAALGADRFGVVLDSVERAVGVAGCHQDIAVLVGCPREGDDGVRWGNGMQ